ncbi:hypothetical protein EZV73_25675 [Acidaminobacter sp. JC074]|uniref:hypothetical protein n=1 Tax=Acidaminobacter sp. JC074 TaxID=2530199 RepID=UPI001F0D8673|nr:hypothetical protein [Acidaminobacter sp. JC074]MCH4890993.1 hypothetical protein [Acidaminobacter sp. JC074]
MSNLFDKSLPKTTSYWKEGNIFFIKNTSFIVNMEEGKAMAELLIFAMKDKETVCLLIDNREAKGAWPKKVSQIWESNDAYISSLQSKKMATLTSSTVTMMQTNRLSRLHGMETFSKAFNTDFNDEVKEFLLGK